MSTFCKEVNKKSSAVATLPARLLPANPQLEMWEPSGVPQN